MIRLETIFVLMGLMTGGVAIVSARDQANRKRWNNGAFWALYAVTFLVGSRLPDFANGVIVLAMVAIAGFGRLGAPSGENTTVQEREQSARRWGNRLFLPALAIPVITILGSRFLPNLAIGGQPLVDPKNIAIVWLGLATVCALIIGLVLLRERLTTPIVEARRLMDSVGWALTLPQMLAALGAVFAIGGVGKSVATLAGRWLPLNTPLAAVIVYTVGMALLTVLMGNAFAAFPVMTAGIALPLVVQHFGGDVTIVCAIGMLSGFCGTLMTPMAANFNIVPARLLELPDDHGVIRVQIPTGIMLLIANTAIMYLFAFHR